MILNDIPPDETLTLTAVMDKLFRIANCEPMCHCCYTVIKVGELFKLATHSVLKRSGTARCEREERDIMLCGNCTIADLKLMEKRKLARLARWRRENPRAGYSRPHLRKDEGGDGNVSSQQTEADQAGAADEKEEAKRQGWNEEEEIEKSDHPPLV